MTPKPSKTFCIYHVIYLPKDLYVDMVKQATGSPCSTPPPTGVPQDAPGAKQFGGAQKGTMSESMALLLHQTWKWQHRQSPYEILPVQWNLTD